MGQAPAPWPVVRLDAPQQRIVLSDLQRIAALRDFQVHAALAAPTVVHLFVEVDVQRDLHRLVQLVKGATARALTVAAGEQPPVDSAGNALAHHKWWSRQYAQLRIADVQLLRHLTMLLCRRAQDRNVESRLSGRCAPAERDHDL